MSATGRELWVAEILRPEIVSEGPGIDRILAPYLSVGESEAEGCTEESYRNSRTPYQRIRTMLSRGYSSISLIRPRRSGHVGAAMSVLRRASPTRRPGAS